jgi:hypothetical protein
MAKLLWALPCFQVLTDRETNTVSYITCVEEMGVGEIPGKFPGLFVGTHWTRTSEEDDYIRSRIRVFNPSGGEVYTKELEERAFEDFQRYRINVQVSGFDITETGKYNIAVEQKENGDWVEKSRFPVSISEVASTEVSDASEKARSDSGE